MTRSRGAHSGLRPIDMRRDMRVVADLIETAFAGRLDPEGRRMLHWMRNLGRAGWIGWLLNYWLLPPAAHPLGFVWEVDGRVVGNASLLKVAGCLKRWVLSNVAVYPDHRRRGIGRALVQASIDMVHRRRGEVILLQVDRDNRVAQVLYASYGFRPLSTRTTWVRRRDQALPATAEYGLARRRKRGEWHEQWELARRVNPEGLIWPFPVAASLFRPNSLLDTFSLDSMRHWVWSEGGKLLASLTARRGMGRGGWRLILVVEPRARGRVEASLLARGLDDLALSDHMVLDYPAGLAVEELQELGFRPERTLTWMAVDLSDRIRG